MMWSRTNSRLENAHLGAHIRIMAQTYANGLYLVRVTTDDRERQLWVAAASREEAVTLVLDTFPEGWSATLLDTRLKPDEVALLKMRPGDVRELSK
jgi:hypothetical protein